MKKLIAIILLIPSITFATTEVVKTVKSSGGDYTSLQAWETGEQMNLVSSDIIKTAELYNMEDTGVVFAGWTTDTTHYIKLVTPIGNRPLGKWSNSCYRITNRVDFTKCIDIQNVDIMIDGLQVKNYKTSANGDGISIFGSTTDKSIYISNCIFELSRYSIGSSSATRVSLYIYNNSISSFSNSGVYFAPDTPKTSTATIYNNTIYIDTFTALTTGVGVAGASVFCKNNIVQIYQGWVSSGSYSFTGNPTSVTSNNISYDNQSPNVSFRNKVVTFVDTSSLTKDLHLLSGYAQNNGVNLTTDAHGRLSFTTDIDDQTRPSGVANWCIGADEIASTPAQSHKQHNTVLIIE